MAFCETLKTTTTSLTFQEDTLGKQATALAQSAKQVSLADTYENANIVALQTRQMIGIQSLSLANQSEQSILQLFR